MGSNGHNGRAARIHAWLLKQQRAMSPMEIRNAVDPTASINHVCVTLGQLVEQGHCARTGSGKGKVRFSAMPKSTVRAPRPVRHSDPRRAIKEAASRYTGLTKPRRTQSKELSRSAPQPRRTDAPNFVSPVSWHLSANDPKRTESARIAADIDRFERSGGRIEKLPRGASAHPLTFNDD